MKVEVLLSSGDSDTLEDVENAKMEMDLGGALTVTRMIDYTVTEADVAKWEEERGRRLTRAAGHTMGPRPNVGETTKIEAVEVVYAPSMWMRFEVIDRA